MAKAALISIRPEWVEKILSGEKTLEVRKTKPKLETPFKCYIYETTEGRGAVVAEFACDTFVCDKTHGHDVLFNSLACMSEAEASAYAGDKELYGWHISGLKIYDHPKELNDFKPINRKCEYSDLGLAIPRCSDCHTCKVERAPQSWRYVEEL